MQSVQSAVSVINAMAHGNCSEGEVDEGQQLE